MNTREFTYKVMDLNTAQLEIPRESYEVRRMIRDGELEAKKYGASYIIRRESIEWWLTQQRLFAES